MSTKLRPQKDDFPTPTHRNAMHRSLELFGHVVDSECVAQTKVILFLNKSDVFKEQLRSGKSLSHCFSERALKDFRQREFWQRCEDTVSGFMRMESAPAPRDVVLIVVQFLVIPKQKPLTPWNGPEYAPILDDEIADNGHFEECHRAALTCIVEAFQAMSRDPKRRVYCHVTDATDTDIIQKIMWDVTMLVTRTGLRHGGLII